MTVAAAAAVAMAALVAVAAMIAMLLKKTGVCVGNQK